MESIFLQLPLFWHAKNRTPHTFAAAAFHAFDAVDVDEAIYFFTVNFGLIQYLIVQDNSRVYLAHDELSGLVDQITVRAAEYDGSKRQYSAHQYHVVQIWTRHLDVPVIQLQARNVT